MFNLNPNPCKLSGTASSLASDLQALAAPRHAHWPKIRLACACIWLSRLAAAWRSGAVDTSRWEFTRQPVLRGARLGVGAARPPRSGARGGSRGAQRATPRRASAAARRARRRPARELGPTHVKLGQIASCRRELGTRRGAAAPAAQDQCRARAARRSCGGAGEGGSKNDSRRSTGRPSRRRASGRCTSRRSATGGASP